MDILRRAGDMIIYKRDVLFLILFLIIFSFSGCATGRKTKEYKRYRVSELVEAIKQNTEKLVSIRCKGGSLAVRLPEEEGAKRIDFDGLVVLYQPPYNFYLSANAFGEPRLIIGSNKNFFWIEVLTDPSRLYWGSWRESASSADNLAAAFLESLGYIQPVSPYYIGPFLQIREDCNVLMYGKLSDRGEWYFAKELQLTRSEPILVNKIIYFEPDGMPSVIIRLRDHLRLESGAYIAKRVEIDFPQKKSFAYATLGRIEEVKDGLPAAAFEFPDIEYFDQVKQLR